MEGNSISFLINNRQNLCRQGTDPLIQTARGKLQLRRSKLNDEINKELRLRNGAENLFRATGNKKLKELVTVELSFFNSNIQLLKEELSELNSSVNIYQHENGVTSVPMVPLGLKETKEIDFGVPLKDFILEHYSEDGNSYEKEIQELMDLRQAIRTPVKDELGVGLLMEYYNQLTCLERRFFPPNRNIGIYFHWYDSLTGVPSMQKTIGFEKGSVLFNVSALYTQIACKQDRTTLSGINLAIEHFERAAGAFNYLCNNFSHAPSMDMQPDTVNMLIKLMLSQAQECIFEKSILNKVPPGVSSYVKVAQEAAKVSELYDETHHIISTDPVKKYVPYSWISMVLVKSQYYKAQAHCYIALGLLDQNDSNDREKLEELSAALKLQDSSPAEVAIVLATNEDKRKCQGKAHLREAIIMHEEAFQVHDLCRQLRKIDPFHGVLRQSHDQALDHFEALEEEDDFSELVTVPPVKGWTEQEAEIIPPNYVDHKVHDIFYKLGPLTVFNAKSNWSAPRTIHLVKDPDYGYGFSVRGDSPVKVANVEPQTNADVGGVKEGDYIIAIEDKDTKWSQHNEVVRLVHEAGKNLVLCLVTPMGEKSSSEPPSRQTTMPRETKIQSLPGSITGSNNKTSKSKNRLSAPWLFIRRNSAKEKSEKVQCNGDIMFS